MFNFIFISHCFTFFFFKPVHEAARAGQKEVVQLLLEHGADINSVTNDGEGQAPLQMAIQTLGEDHPMVEYLLSLGAIEAGPDL